MENQSYQVTGKVVEGNRDVRNLSLSLNNLTQMENQSYKVTRILSGNWSLSLNNLTQMENQSYQVTNYQDREERHDF